MTSIIQKVIHFGFDITGRIAPVTAGRAAFRLFSLTPPRRPAKRKARRALELVRPAMDTAKRIVLPISGGSVSTWYFPALANDAPQTVLVVHGWGSRSEYMLDMIHALQNSGKAVVAIDLPGHGASSGRTLTMASAVEAVDAAWRQYGPFSVMLGHSFGGAVVLNAAAGSVEGFAPRNPDKLVLISAPNSLPAVFAWFADFLGLRAISRRSMYDRVEQLTGHPLSAFVGTLQLAALGTPALIVHDPEDREVTADSATAFASAGAHVEVLWAEGYGHRRILKAPGVLQAVIRFSDRERKAMAA
ncbi:alpha/beta hydrolase [Nitratireductor sp. XY-223]|uniref:alpha/beta hydrolase n=1 Tax=Nitratireductor sp. XY-223 TaxID=2561926 RepID=UPI0010A9AA62|nr:alpha/beta hydrolase [Nitratireductor sp. XY-223]